MSKIYAPTIKSHKLRGDKKSEKKVDEDYPFCMPLRRLQYENQVSYLFDGSNKPKPKSSGPNKIYEGKIARIKAKLIFSSQSTSNLCAKRQKSLDKAHKKASERLNKVYQDLEDYLD